MIGPRAAWLQGGRLHLQHGPIDLVIGAEGPGAGAAFQAAGTRFATVLEALVGELPRLRTPVQGPPPGAAPGPFSGPVARRMRAAALPHAARVVTPMAAVAGAVADEVLAAMCAAAPGRLRRAYVNNGGDIALTLTPGARFEIGLHGLGGAVLGRLSLGMADGVGGVATSGQGGRSLSLGLADSVTVVAADAAAADVAATLIANAVDLPGHPAVIRAPAISLDPDSDLGHRHVVTGCGALSKREVARALMAGATTAEQMRADGLIAGAMLWLRGHLQSVGAMDTLGAAPALGELAHA